MTSFIVNKKQNIASEKEVQQSNLKTYIFFQHIYVMLAQSVGRQIFQIFKINGRTIDSWFFQ